MTSNSPLDMDIMEFMIDRESRGLSPRTIGWYRHGLKMFGGFLAGQGVTETSQVTPGVLRRYLIHLTEDHNAGGQVNLYGTVKVFLTWYGSESAPAGWVNPVARVKTPKRPQKIVEPISLDDVRKLLATCNSRSMVDARDRALILFLLDSGVRKQELTDMNLADVDLESGQVIVRKGKGSKGRVVYVGSRTRKALLGYLRHRTLDGADGEPLWVTVNGGRLSYQGAREIIRRRAKAAGIKDPAMHAFRRAFAVNYLRNGGDLATLQRLMGHSDLAVLRRYLALVDADLAAGHKRAGVVDRL